MHGDNDSVVPIHNSDRPVQKVKQSQIDLRDDIVPGQDHAFDIIESTWASFRNEALEFLKEGWLQ